MTTTPTPAGRLLLKDVRLSFANGLFEAKAGEDGGQAKFNCGIILSPDHPQIPAIKAAMQAVATEKWGAKAADVFKQLKASDKLALHDGDSKAYDGYAGNLFLSPSSPTRPTLLDGQKNPVTQADGKIYSGCYVNASVEIWAMDNKFGKRINCQLRGVQFNRDGDAFSAGRPADADEFEAVTDGAGADAFA
jgi:hypothetical protein